MEDYAERLRALHRDLSLVLEAVERGLAVSAGRAAEQEPPPAPDPPPAPERAPLEPQLDADLDADPTPPPEPEPILLHTRTAPGAPRVEVLPAPSGAATREEDEERRSPMSMPADPAGQDPPSFAAAPFPPRPSVRELDDPDLPAEPSWVERPDAAPPRSAGTTAVWATPPQPAGPSVRVESAAAPPSPADRPWVQSSTVPGGEATWGEPRPPARRRLSPMLLTALLTGWLVAIALLVTLMLG